MIPSDFKDYFVQSSISEQQSIISSLLSMTKDGYFSDTGERKVMNFPHCKSEKIWAWQTQYLVLKYGYRLLLIYTTFLYTEFGVL